MAALRISAPKDVEEFGISADQHQRINDFMNASESEAPASRDSIAGHVEAAAVSEEEERASTAKRPSIVARMKEKMKSPGKTKIKQPTGGKWRLEKGKWEYHPTGVLHLVTSASEPRTDDDSCMDRFRKWVSR